MIKDKYYFDDFGFLHIPNMVLSHQGTFDYLLDDGNIMTSFMPAQELAALSESNKGSAITLEHPQNAEGKYQLLSPTNFQSYATGYLADELRVEDGNLLGHLVVADSATQEGILNGDKKGISLGYVAHNIPVTMQDEQGKTVNSIKRGLKLNHIAVVESPRATKAVFQLDSADYTLDNNLKSLLKPTISLDSSDFKPIAKHNIPTIQDKQMPTENKETVDQLLEMQSKMISLQANFDSLKATLETTVKEKEAIALELQAAKSASEGLTAAFDSFKSAQPTEDKINEIVASRVQAWAKAGDKVTFDSAMTELDIQRARLTVDHPTHAEAFKAASADYLNAFEAAYDSLQSAAPKAPKPTFDSTAAVTGAVIEQPKADKIVRHEDGSMSLFNIKAKARR